VAKGTSHTQHVLHLETHLLLPKNTKASVVLDRFHPITSCSTVFTCTAATAKIHVKTSMLIDNPCSKHHGAKQPIDLAAICHKIDGCNVL